MRRSEQANKPEGILLSTMYGRDPLDSIRLDTETKKQLERPLPSARNDRAFLAAEAIAQYVEAEEWQLGEIRAGLADLDKGRTVSHKKVSQWLKSWGRPSEG
jgi:predicted transcriptional regulator